MTHPTGSSRRLSAGTLRRERADLRVDVETAIAFIAAPSGAVGDEPSPGLVIEVDAELPTALRGVFAGSLREALGGRPRVRAVRVTRGRSEREVTACVDVAGRREELRLYFPEAPALQSADVLRIVRSVLEAMGPAAP